MSLHFNGIVKSVSVNGVAQVRANTVVQTLHANGAWVAGASANGVVDLTKPQPKVVTVAPTPEPGAVASAWTGNATHALLTTPPNEPLPAANSDTIFWGTSAVNANAAPRHAIVNDKTVIVHGQNVIGPDGSIVHDPALHPARQTAVVVVDCKLERDAQIYLGSVTWTVDVPPGMGLPKLGDVVTCELK